MAIEIEEPALFDNVLHYGLLLGAIFQMICILAVIFIPKSESEQDKEEDIKQLMSQQNVASHNTSSTSSKKNKRERKKNR